MAAIWPSPLFPRACAGYINYIEFYECSATNGGLRFLTFVLFLAWMLFLLHLVETTTNDYFCTSLQLAVAILQLSPNVSEKGRFALARGDGFR